MTVTVTRSDPSVTAPTQRELVQPRKPTSTGLRHPFRRSDSEALAAAIRTLERPRINRTRFIILLRMTLVIATSYLLFAQSQPYRIEPVTAVLLLSALASNIAFKWIPSTVVESERFAMVLVVVDTLWVTASLFYSGQLQSDFYFVYFFIPFLAAISESLVMLSMGTCLVAAGYFYLVFATQGADIAFSSPTLVRLPFLFGAASLYGYFSDRVRYERQSSILRIALEDALTGLPNRRALEERMDRAIGRLARSGGRIAILFFDLDNFKFVNDTYGHEVGDQLLIAIADRLSTNVRGIDVLGRMEGDEVGVPSRLGGDEFAVILTDVRDLDGLAQAGQRLIAAIAEPVTVNDVEVAITASVGVAVLDGEKDESKILQSETEAVRHRLFMQADRALYRAKQKGRSGLEFHDHEMDREISMRISLGRELRGVLSRDEIYVEYQPQVDLEELTVAGAEALVRWRNPERGVVEPSLFIPIAESSGEIRAIGRWILEVACGEAKRWSEEHAPGIPVVVNISAVQLRDPDLPDVVGQVLQDHKLPANLLELELTEGLLLHATPDVKKSLERLNHEIGVTISLDDFGRGFSSLEYLYRLPFDKLKVDRFFVSTMDEDSASFAIVSAIVALGKKLGLVVIAEGVERKEQAESLRSLGCDRAQGYYYSKSISSRALSDILAAGGRIVPSAATDITT